MSDPSGGNAKVTLKNGRHFADIRKNSGMNQMSHIRSICADPDRLVVHGCLVCLAMVPLILGFGA